MAIVVHSKNIYDKKNNKVIDNNIGKIDYSENMLTGEDNKEIFHSGDIYIYNDRELRSDVQTINSQYNINISQRDTGSFADISYNIDLKTIDDIFYRDISKLKVKVHLNNNGYNLISPTLQNMYYKDAGSSLVNKDVKILQTLDSNDSCTISIVNDILSISIRTKVSQTATVIESGGSVYEWYTQNYSFSILTKAYKSTFNNKTYGNGKSWALPSNELMQSTTTISEDTVAESLIDKVLVAYANGKETAELLCSINEYKYTDGNIAITTKKYEYPISKINLVVSGDGKSYSATIPSAIDYRLKIEVEYNNKFTNYLYINAGETTSNTNTTLISASSHKVISAENDTPLIFAIGDVIIPYIFTPDGEMPMSRYRNGTAKQFHVTATEIIFDGAIWQKLTLQEKTFVV